MTREVVSVAPEATLEAAARLMVEHAVTGLPVLDRAGVVVGVVSDGDIALPRRRQRADPWWRRMLEDWVGTGHARCTAPVPTRVADVMSMPAITVHPDLHVLLVGVVLEHRGIRRLPVVEEGRLVGILTRADLVRGMVSREAAGRPRAMGAPAGSAAVYAGAGAP